ncbi:unnamed protein product [Lupinus luteus]|uniref:Aluminum-activated malate transporter n=1 Tax=Lupinus luteus TaxID=3873 RepID=A0AAV1VSM6_LUPLU
MAHNNKGVVKRVEWRISVGDGSSERVGHSCMWAMIVGLALKLYMFMKKAWEIGLSDPRKFIHCLKVGIALTCVSLFYYLKPLYDGVGGNAMWAVMTVIVVFENTAASAATFSRFIPTIKARFDYGALIFILTFSLISISGYRVDELMNMAQQRILTIIIGTCLCIIVSLTICPIWAGQELHVLVTGNLDKLANSLQGCVTQYFSHSETSAGSDEESNRKLANLARWEPAHGCFKFRHPWKQYLKIAASMRNCASCIDALIGCINSENKAPDQIKKNMRSISLKVVTNCASLIRELAITMRNMTKSSKVDILIMEMNSSAQELSDLLKSYSNLVDPSESHNAQAKLEIPVMEIIEVVTLASLLIEIVARVKCIVKAVEELSDSAKFKPAKCKQHAVENKISPDQEKDEEAINKIQIVL